MNELRVLSSGREAPFPQPKSNCVAIADTARLSESECELLVHLVAEFAKEESPKAAMSNEAGRGFVKRIVVPGGASYIVRRYHRGGLMKSLLGSSFLTARTTRPIHEFGMLLALNDAGVKVPRPGAAVSVPGWFGLVYTGAIATEEIADSRNLLQALNESVRVDVLEYGSLLAGREAARALRLGIHHTDLHLANVVLTGSGESWLVDFDKSKPAHAASLTELEARWVRSVRKHGAPPGMAGAFSEGLRTEG